MVEWRDAIPFIRKLILAGVISGFFMVLAIFPRTGYYGEAHIPLDNIERHPSGFWLANVECNVSYNPFLYPFSWLIGRGQFSINFSLVSVPTYIGGGDVKYPKWRSQAELEEEALLTLILRELPINILSSFFILLVIELMEIRGLYISLIGGLIGFPFGGVAGAFIGFCAGVIAVLLVLPKLKERGVLKGVWETGRRTGERRSY